jgi:hypothetical protein
MDEFYLLALTIKDGSRFSYPPSAHKPYCTAKPKFRSCLVGRLGLPRLSAGQAPKLRFSG